MAVETEDNRADTCDSGASGAGMGTADTGDIVLSDAQETPVGTVDDATHKHLCSKKPVGPSSSTELFLGSLRKAWPRCLLQEGSKSAPRSEYFIVKALEFINSTLWDASFTWNDPVGSTLRWQNVTPQAKTSEICLQYYMGQGVASEFAWYFVGDISPHVVSGGIGVGNLGDTQFYVSRPAHVFVGAWWIPIGDESEINLEISHEVTSKTLKHDNVQAKVTYKQFFLQPTPELIGRKGVYLYRPTLDTGADAAKYKKLEAACKKK